VLLAVADNVLQKVDLCQSIRDAVPGVPDLLKKAGGVCTCMPKVLKLAANSNSVSSLLSTGDLSAVSGEVLKLWGDANQVRIGDSDCACDVSDHSMLQCFANNAFEVKDNKNELTQSGGALQQANNVFIFRAREVSDNLWSVTSIWTHVFRCPDRPISLHSAWHNRCSMRLWGM
jgi:hypothetical protein